MRGYPLNLVVKIVGERLARFGGGSGACVLLFFGCLVFEVQEVVQGIGRMPGGVLP